MKRSLGILLSGAALLSACQPRVNLNHFVIPAGYIGPIAVVSDPSFDSTPAFVDGRYLHTVPSNAVVCIDSEKAFRPFLLTGVYSDGNAIYSFAQGHPAPPTETAIRIAAFGAWHGRIKNSSVLWLGVGDAETVEELEGMFFGKGIEGRMPQGVRIDRTADDDFKHLSRYCSQE